MTFLGVFEINLSHLTLGSFNQLTGAWLMSQAGPQGPEQNFCDYK